MAHKQMSVGDMHLTIKMTGILNKYVKFEYCDSVLSDRFIRPTEYLRRWYWAVKLLIFNRPFARSALHLKF